MRSIKITARITIFLCICLYLSYFIFTDIQLTKIKEADKNKLDELEIAWSKFLDTLEKKSRLKKIVDVHFNSKNNSSLYNKYQEIQPYSINFGPRDFIIHYLGYGFEKLDYLYPSVKWRVHDERILFSIICGSIILIALIVLIIVRKIKIQIKPFMGIIFGINEKEFYKKLTFLEQECLLKIDDEKYFYNINISNNESITFKLTPFFSSGLLKVICLDSKNCNTPEAIIDLYEKRYNKSFTHTTDQVIMKFPYYQIMIDRAGDKKEISIRYEINDDEFNKLKTKQLAQEI